MTGSMPKEARLRSASYPSRDRHIPNGCTTASGAVEHFLGLAGKIIAGNIKFGVTILGVSGSYSGESV